MELTTELHPRVHAALQDQLERRRGELAAGARHVGWTVVTGVPEIDAFPSPGPLSGYLTSATVYSDGALCDVAGGRELRAEVEVVIELARDAAATAVAVPAIVGVAIELVDVARPPHSMEAIVASNLFHRAVVVGRARAGALATAALARVWIDGRLREVAPVTTDVDATIRRLAHVLASVREPLRAGDLILAGALIHVPARVGDTITAEIDGVGRVETTISG